MWFSVDINPRRQAASDVLTLETDDRTRRCGKLPE
jgi:hypothetical protein